jgi:alpha-galactosidase
MSKIVIIGAGSSSFGPSIVGDLFSYPIHLRDSEIWLVDTNQASLDLVARYAGRINQSQGELFDIRVTTDRAEALPGADFVVVAVSVDRIAAWKRDWQIPLKHGVRHVLGENGGPGGLSHTLRMVPVILEIARDIERLAPHALMLNLSNPMSRLCMAVRQHTNVRVVGLCHQIDEGYRLVNQVLGLHKAQPGADETTLTRNIKRRIKITAAGLNHFTFMLKIEDRLRDGRDLYPEFRARLAQMPASFELMSRRLHDSFGLFCATGDRHAGEYVGFAAETQALSGYDYAAYEAKHAARVAKMQAVLSGEIAHAYSVVETSNERVIPIIAALSNDVAQSELSVNVANDGFIDELQAQAIVEVPGRVDPSGVSGLPVGALPRGLISMMRREVDIQMLTVEAAVRGDRGIALQALLLDPQIHSYAQATHLLDELLMAQKALLPQFA